MTHRLVADFRLVPVIFRTNPWMGLLKHFLALVPAASVAPKGSQDPCYVQDPLFYHESLHLSSVKLQYLTV